MCMTPGSSAILMTPTSFLFISCPLGIFCMVWTRNPPVSPYWRMSKKWKGIGLWTRLCLLFPMPSGPLRSLSRVGLTSLRMTRTAPSDTKSSHVGEVASVPLSAGAVEARPPPTKYLNSRNKLWCDCFALILLMNQNHQGLGREVPF